MEMNTRLQVETSRDRGHHWHRSSAWQLRVAARRRVAFGGRRTVESKGTRFEAALYAEDVLTGFLPATGTLTICSLHPRVVRHRGVGAQAIAINPFYDPMIAKVIVHGDNVTRDRLGRGCAQP